MDAECWRELNRLIISFLFLAFIYFLIEVFAAIFPCEAEVLNEADELRKGKPPKIVGVDYLQYREDELRKGSKKFISEEGKE